MEPAWEDLTNMPSMDSFVMPSDPHARAHLLSELQDAYPSLRIPPELQPGGAAAAPPHRPLQTPPAHPPLPGPSPSPFGVAAGDPAAFWGAPSGEPVGLFSGAAKGHGHRVESSVDLDSPRGNDPDAPFLAMPSGPAAHLEAEHLRIARRVSDGAGLLRSPEATLRTPMQGLPEAPTTQKQTFYDKLGRQLTALLLDSGTPLPRPPMATPAKAAAAPAEPALAATPTPAAAATPAALPQTPAGPSGSDGKAMAAAEMFMKDYYELKGRQQQLEQRLRESEGENLAMRSQLDLAVAKMMAAQKETDRYAEYFTLANSDAGADKGDQVQALLNSMKDLNAELVQAREDKAALQRDQDAHVAAAVEKAIEDHRADAAKLKAQLREKKKMIKEMRQVLFSYLANNDPGETGPRMAFLSMMGGQAPEGSISAGVAY
eukprot:TRINITY_DN13431_c0_g1_i1.p1 TRINITY_DN13431_c0_g1~~TRINITY_DN13431_c0_g1_i1.p1  ORF type:complete len:450 (+),score=176.66 TRINITY_DN13431_c0_g1_i1:59-1351(+)